MAGHLLSKDGHLVSDGTHLVSIDDATDPGDCECCGASYPPPSSCDGCVNAGPGTTAPGAFLVEITGSTCGINGSYVVPYHSAIGSSACRYLYSLPSSIPTGGSQNFISVTVTVRVGFGTPPQIQVTFVTDGTASESIQWQNTGSALKDCDDYSAVSVTLNNNPLACTEGSCSVTAL